jgi:hypothetical protein
MSNNHDARSASSKKPRRRTEEQRRRAFQSVRIGDLTKVFGYRYGGGKLYQFPDDDAGRDDLHILVDHYAYANPLAIYRVLKARAPWLLGVEQDSLLDEINRFPRRWTAQALATALNFTETERRKLRVRTVGSIDVTKEERQQQRKLATRAPEAEGPASRRCQAPRRMARCPRKPAETVGASRCQSPDMVPPPSRWH